MRILATLDNAGDYDRILVLNPNGNPLAPAAAYGNGAAIFPISATGTYTILLEGETITNGPVASVPYTLTAFVDPAPTPVAFATPTLGTLANQNAIPHYSFNLAAATSVVFNSLSANYYVNWTLTGPNGYSLSRNFYIPAVMNSAAPIRSCSWRRAPTR